MLENIFSIKNVNSYKVVTIFGIKLKISRYKLQNVKPFKNNKPTLALQVNIMDRGGLEEVVLQLATSQDIREKYNVVIIAEINNKGYLAKIAREQGIPVYSCFSNYKYLEKLIKKLKITIVHFHYNLFGIKLYKAHGVRTIYTIHNNYIWFDEEGVIERNTHYKYIDKFIAVSSQVKEFFCEKFGISKDKVDVIPNGIEYFDTSDVIPVSKKEIGLKEDDFVFLNVATFIVTKYHFTQIKALSLLVDKYSNMKLVMIGNRCERHPYFSRVNKFIDDLKLKNNVKIIDYIPKSEIYRHIKMSDAIIMTSFTEGFGLAVAEGMLLRKPIIMTDIAAARDFVQNNDIGIVVKHAYSNLQELNLVDVEKDCENQIYHFDNVEDVAQAMENMYLNRTEWGQKAKLGQEKIKNYFNVQRVQNDYFKKYEELCK